MPLRIVQSACILALLAITVGCSHPLVSERDVQPLPYMEGGARSLALTSQFVQSNQLLPPGYGAWYAGRNDVGPSVTAGTQSLRHESSVTYTRDRQHSFNGRVFDAYQETTYRRTTTESTR